MPSLSLNIGLNNGRKLPFGGGAAPSGIPVATTEQIYINGNLLYRAGTAPNYYYTDNGDYSFENPNSYGSWTFVVQGDSVYFYYSGETNPLFMPFSFTDGGVTFTITPA
jgi:hypothetical protein